MSDNVIAAVVIIGIGIVTLAVPIALLLLRDRLTQPSGKKIEEIFSAIH